MKLPEIERYKLKTSPDKKLHSGVYLKNWFIALALTTVMSVSACGGVSVSGGTPCITRFRENEAKVTLTAIAVINIEDATKYPSALNAQGLTDVARLPPVKANCSKVEEIATYTAGTIQAYNATNASNRPARTADPTAIVTANARLTQEAQAGQTLAVMLATGLSGTATAQATPNPLEATLVTGMTQTATVLATPNPGQ